MRFLKSTNKDILDTVMAFVFMCLEATWNWIYSFFK